MQLIFIKTQINTFDTISNAANVNDLIDLNLIYQSSNFLSWNRVEQNYCERNEQHKNIFSMFFFIFPKT